MGKNFVYLIWMKDTIKRMSQDVFKSRVRRGELFSYGGGISRVRTVIFFIYNKIQGLPANQEIIRAIKKAAAAARPPMSIV